jgi:hypothetical protein
MKRTVYTLMLLLLLTSKSYAYLSLAESAELPPPNKYQVGGETQFLTNRGGGANLNVFFDSRINESSSFRAAIGGGTVDFNAFGSFKWIPIPDFDNQPAMGFRFGAGIARDEDQNLLQLQVAPLASKRYRTDWGMTTPYISVPFTFINSKQENYVASNFVIGSEYGHPDFEYGSFGVELGFELNKSYSYISLYATFPFDSRTGFRK